MSLYPVLTSIVDKNNAALLTFTRDGNNALSQVSDRYGRSVYYHVGSYQTSGVPAPYTQSVQALDHVSQVVPTGTASPPDRHVLGYQNVSNGENSEAIPMLHTITAPSPTGTGTQTATINYLPGLCTVSSVTDGNGNTRSYNQTDANHTQVNVTDAGNNASEGEMIEIDCHCVRLKILRSSKPPNENSPPAFSTPPGGRRENRRAFSMHTAVYP